MIRAYSAIPPLFRRIPPTHRGEIGNGRRFYSAAVCLPIGGGEIETRRIDHAETLKSWVYSADLRQCASSAPIALAHTGAHWQGSLYQVGTGLAGPPSPPIGSSKLRPTSYRTMSTSGAREWW